MILLHTIKRMKKFCSHGEWVWDGAHHPCDPTQRCHMVSKQLWGPKISMYALVKEVRAKEKKVEVDEVGIRRPKDDMEPFPMIGGLEIPHEQPNQHMFSRKYRKQ
jgi:hypothetical protein